MEAWTERVLARLDSPWRAALVAEPGVWLVGGAVRDLLLGRVPRELDVVVEGDAVALARRLGTPVAVHERFGTATLPGLDLATARTERYAAPGALPEVTVGVGVREDLARRDFTANALAVRLADGTGMAFPGALADVEAGVLRVLHDGSFLDDPTRLLRLVRYASRLGFDVEQGTAALAEDAVSLGALASVSGARIGAEVRLLLEEPQPEGVAALERFGLGRAAVHPAFAAYRPLLRAALDALPGGGVGPRDGDVAAGGGVGSRDGGVAAGGGVGSRDGGAAAGGGVGPRDGDVPAGAGGPARAGEGHRGRTALAAALVEVPRGELAGVLDGLGFPGTERDVVVAAAEAPALALRLSAADRPSAVAEAVGRAPVEAVAVAAALGAAEPAARWLAEWRHVRPAIGGDDLLAAGLAGPAVGAGLRAARALALDEPGADRDAQLAAALRAAGA